MLAHAEGGSFEEFILYKRHDRDASFSCEMVRVYFVLFFSCFLYADGNCIVIRILITENANIAGVVEIPRVTCNANFVGIH